MNLDPRRLRIWALGLVPLLVVAVVAAVVTLRGDDGGPRAVEPPPGPVLLVAGYGGSTASLEPLAARLRAAGRQAVVVPPVGDNTGPLVDQARVLQAVAQQQVAAGAPSVDVVAYSAGGVVARIWAADLGGAAVARRMVTLGSPHHGTTVAGLAARFAAGSCPAACRELTTDSALLADLPATPAGPRWVSIWTADDDVVTPPDSAELDGAVDIELQQVCPGVRVGHGQLTGAPLPTALTLQALTGPGLEAAPPPSACAGLTGSSD